MQTSIKLCICVGMFTLCCLCFQNELLTIDDQYHAKEYRLLAPPARRILMERTTSTTPSTPTPKPSVSGLVGLVTGTFTPTTSTSTSTSTPTSTSTTTTTTTPRPSISQIETSDSSSEHIELTKPILPFLYVITPTFKRPEQVPEITRLGQTLKHVENLFWLVIEDAHEPTHQVTKALHRVGVPFIHLIAPMPDEHRYSGKPTIPKGVSNRNRGLEWLRANATDGVFYFADDDNTYDLEIFEQMRFTKKVSLWPVGLVTKLGMSSPIVRDGKLDGFYDGWIGSRKYPVDMAGFAVSVKFLLSRPEAIMPYTTSYEEDGFLKSLAPLENSEFELLANRCTEILVWHTQTKKNKPATELDQTLYNNTNLVHLRTLIV